MKGLNEIGNIRGKKILLRAGLNVPVTSGVVQNDFRLRKLLPTLQFLSEAGAKTILLGHIGRDGMESLEPVAMELGKHIAISFGERMLSNMEDGDIVMLENIRRDEGELKNTDSFTRYLASLADIYVNDAFSVSHRDHASVVGVPKLLPSYAGFLFQEEVEELQKARNPESPSLFILGGAKFETKKPLIEKFLDVYDIVFVGGALANDFFKAKGYGVGTSTVSSGPFEIEHCLTHDCLMLPTDVTALSRLRTVVKAPQEVASYEKIVDIGPRTLRELQGKIQEASFILWNGPLGVYEEGFSSCTEEVMKHVAKSSAYSVVGGGDTVASIAHLGVESDISFISTGGGAMLTYLSEGTLPGIKALE